jgi:hypothetical protein
MVIVYLEGLPKEWAVSMVSLARVCVSASPMSPSEGLYVRVRVRGWGWYNIVDNRGIIVV